MQALVDGWAKHQAPSTVRRQYAALRAMFACAEDTARLPRSPCYRIQLPRGHLVERPTLSTDELERLAEVLDEDQAPMMWARAVLGLRWAEAAGLTVDRLGVLRREAHRRLPARPKRCPRKTEIIGWGPHLRLS